MHSFTMRVQGSLLFESMMTDVAGERSCAGVDHFVLTQSFFILNIIITLIKNSHKYLMDFDNSLLKYLFIEDTKRRDITLHSPPRRYSSVELRETDSFSAFVLKVTDTAPSMSVWRCTTCTGTPRTVNGFPQVSHTCFLAFSFLMECTRAMCFSTLARDAIGCNKYDTGLGQNKLY